MGIVNCTNCKKKISDKAPDCSHCGFGKDAAANPIVKHGLGRPGYVVLCILNVVVFVWPVTVSAYAHPLMLWLIIGFTNYMILSAFRLLNIGENMIWALLTPLPIVNLLIFAYLCTKPTRYVY